MTVQPIAETTKLPESANLPIPKTERLTQAQIAKAAGISERNLRYAIWLLSNAPPEIIEQLEAGNISIHKALNLCGYQQTQGRRNNEFKRKVVRLCEAVLNGQPEAEYLAAKLLIKLVGESEVANVC